jgi:hypothetical protein
MKDERNQRNKIRHIRHIRQKRNDGLLSRKIAGKKSKDPVN